MNGMVLMPICGTEARRSGEPDPEKSTGMVGSLVFLRDTPKIS